ncbi:tyrosine-type recombinase/integrase [Cetobacterium sp.]|uniref:site-specific integrase n=1 Tax=Cetobacterium sp. TaxID=2071632 RepID=UPI003F2C2275
MPVYKNKKTGKYYVSFYYTTWEGKRQRKKKEGFLKKRDAESYERNFIVKKEGGGNLTFDLLVEMYLEDQKVRVRPTTYELQKGIIIKQILPFFKDMEVKEIKVVNIRQWQNNLLDRENKYSETYLRTLNTRLSAIFNYGVKIHNLLANPCRKCGTIGKKNASSMKFWTKKEYNIFIKSLENNFMAKVIYDIFFYTGMRLGELLALTLNDIDFEKKIVKINKTCARLKGKDIIQPPKTPKSNREIQIPEFLSNEIQEYIKKLYDYKANEHLFPVTKDYLHKVMKRGAKETGVKRIRIHDLRHSHVALLIEMNFSPLLIADRVGHDNVQTTLQTYGHLYPNKQVEVAIKLDEQMRSEKNDKK